jgi:uncharacterized protein (TIGR01244 family)
MKGANMMKYKQIGDGLFIGPQPTEQDLREAKQQGVHTVIDFRMPEETATPNADLVTRNGLNYVNVPVNKDTLSEQQIGDLDEAMKGNDGPYLLHCATGARAAMLLALSGARQNGWTAERTFQEAESMGFNLQSSPGFSAFVKQATGK